MFVYLTKKIALANQKKIYCLSWSHRHGVIAVGADNGLLKVLKLDIYQMSNKNETKEQSKFLSVNQTLEGHTNSVIHLGWNDKYEKLISSDVNGLIIVWIFYKGNYYEEMVNSRNRSVVIGVKWTADGEKICIVYEDGSVIVGSVDGHRLWTKEIAKMIKLTCAEWSPDGRMLLFGTANGQVHCYDHSGNFFKKATLFLKLNQNVENKFTYSSTQISVVCMSWYPRISNGKSKFKDLAIAFSTGEIHLLSNENDDDAIVIQTDLTAIKQIEWNPFGRILAVCGSTDQSLATNEIKFYDKLGNLSCNLIVPGDELVCCSWSRCGSRIALGVDSHILFASVRTQYKWAFFADTFAFSLPKPTSSLETFDQDAQLLIFYQIKNNKMTTKVIPQLVDLCAKDQYCCIGTNLLNEENSPEMKSSLQLCNSIGITIDTISIDFNINCLTMNNSRAICCSNDSFCIWKFKTPINPESTSSSVESSELENYDKLFNVYLSRSETKINCCTCSDKILVIAQLNSIFAIYTLPRASLAFKLNLQNSVPKQIALNLNSDRLAILSINGKFNIFLLEHNSGKLLEFNRKDCWDFEWSCDSNSFLVLNQKTKLCMFTFKDQFTPEDKQELATGTTFGYLYEVKNLVAKVVNFDNFYLDLIEKNLDIFHLSNYIELFESDLLKTTKLLFEAGDLGKISKFIEQNSNHTLWTLLEDQALRALNFEIAEMALVKCRNFKGIQFLNRLKKLNDKNLQQAEVHLYLREFDQARAIYQQTGRLDLEINMQKMFGNWKALLELVKNELGADQTSLGTVYDELGQFYFEKQDYLLAIDCFKQTGNHELLKRCLIRLEKYDEIKKLAMNPSLNDLQLARYLESSGMCEQAVTIYLNCDEIEKAIDCAIQLNEWQKAIELAQQHSVRSIDGLLESYAEHLRSKRQEFSIVELYRKAKNYSKAIQHLLKLALKMRAENCDQLKMKKIYCVVGILCEEKKAYESNELNMKTKGGNKLNSLLNDDLIGDQNLQMNDVWRGAKAYHFYILAQRQLLDGYFDAAMKTSLLLIDYEQFIDTVQIYSLIGLASALNRNFSICSKAFIKLELLDCNDENVYKKLAFEIFSKYPPKLPANLNKIECPFCATQNYDFNTSCSNCETKFQNVCIASGRQISDLNEIWTCRCCKQSAIKSDLISHHSCPLCHCSI